MRDMQRGPLDRNTRWLAVALLILALLAVWLEWRLIDLLQLPGEAVPPAR